MSTGHGALPRGAWPIPPPGDPPGTATAAWEVALPRRSPGGANENAPEDGDASATDQSSEPDAATLASIRAIGRAAGARAAEIRAAHAGERDDLERIYTGRPWAAEQGGRLHQALAAATAPPTSAASPASAAIIMAAPAAPLPAWAPAAQPNGCPAHRLEQLLAGLRNTVMDIQRAGPERHMETDPRRQFRWSHVVNPLIWLSLPLQRAALVRAWALLGLPLQLLERLADGLRQMGITTPTGLGEWLTTLTTGNTRVERWA